MIKYRFVDKGEFFPGLPARDITAEEFEAMTDEQKDQMKSAVSAGMYQDTKSADKKSSAE